MAWKRVAALFITCQALHYAPPQPTRRRQQIRMQATATAQRPAKLDTLVNAMAGLPDDKYRYKQLRHWAQEAPSLPLLIKLNPIKCPGAVDGVVVASPDEDGTVVLQGDSDAQLTKGLVVLLVKGLSGALEMSVRPFIKECGAASLHPSEQRLREHVGGCEGESGCIVRWVRRWCIDVDALSAKLAALRPVRRGGGLVESRGSLL